MDILEEITATNLPFVGIVRQPTGAVCEIKNRRSFALSVSLGGKIIYTHGEENHTSDIGTVTLHPQGESYTLKCERGGEFIVIEFFATRFFTNRFKTFHISRPELITERYHSLREAHVSGSRTETLSEFYALLNLISSDIALAENPILAPIIAYLDENFTGEDISNSRLAEMAHISESYVRRLFLKYYQKTPRQYVISLRVGLAKRLLAENRHSVGEVSEKCGFSSVFHFCRTFKEAVGETPLAYAKKYRATAL